MKTYKRRVWQSCAVRRSEHFQIIVFVGANQLNIPIELVSSMQELGDKARYLQIAGIGNNVLDFHIAYYLGDLTARDENACFHIISKDAGYDQLIKHLKRKELNITRCKDLFEIPWLSAANKETQAEQITAIIDNLSARGASRPRKMKTLKNTIKDLFGDTLETKELDDLVEDLQNQKYIIVDGDNVTYSKLEQLQND